MTRAFAVALVAVLALGATAAGIAPVAGEPLLTGGDLLAGWGLAVAAASVARAGATGSGWVLLGAGAAWFGGTLATELGSGGDWLLYFHRPLLALAVVAAPGWRPRSATAAILVAGAFLAAVPDVAEAGWPVALLAAGVIALGPRRPALLACGAALALAVAAAQLTLSPEGLRWLVLAYDAAIVVTGAALAAELRAGSGLADRMVEMGERGPLSQALAAALGDASIEVLKPGIEAGDERVLTPVEDGGRVVAVIAHAPETLADPRVAGAAISATRLAVANAELTGELEATLAELRASSRRLVLAGETARSGLERRLREGPMARLDRIGAQLDGADVAARVAGARRELEDLAAGLHPRALAEHGLAGAIERLASGAPVPVHLDVAAGAWPDSVEAAAYFVCAEALTNVAKYAQATRADLRLAEEDGALLVTVADDGAGGADPAAGSGLRGLSDRLVALGGSLTVESEPGQGTRLTGCIPLT